MTREEETQSAIEWIEGLRDSWNDKDNVKYCNMAIKALEKTDVPDTNVGKLDGDPIDIDKAIEHYEGTLEMLKGVGLEVDT